LKNFSEEIKDLRKSAKKRCVEDEKDWIKTHFEKQTDLRKSAGKKISPLPIAFRIADCRRNKIEELFGRN
jgi:hypothetical protein